MHGLINRSMESFLNNTYGPEVWLGVVKDAGLGFEHFESMFTYDDALSYAVLEAAAKRLSKSHDTLVRRSGHLSGGKSPHPIAAPVVAVWRGHLC